MESHFTAEFFVNNRKKLRTLFTGTAPIVLTANGLLQRNSDVTFPFRQDSSFWYLTGIDEPDLILVMDKDKEYLIMPHRTDMQAVFDGAIESDQLTACSGIQTVFDHKTGWKQLDTRLKRVKHIATLAAAPPYITKHGFYVNPARANLIKRLKELVPNAELLDLRPHVTRLRMVKQTPELDAIKQAIAITTTTLKEVTAKLSQYQYEYEVEAAITAGFRRRGADHAYQPIVASGANACTLHYVANNSALDAKKSLLIDVGAEVDHYAADITRSYALSKPNKRLQSVFNAVLEVQAFASSSLKPGILMKDYEHAVEQFMGEKLRALGLIKTIEREAVKRYYPHATSHFLGLDVHDVADYDRPLEANMVLTVEPGIYIAQEGIGVRIEDNVMISQKGIKVLSSGLLSALQ